MKAEILCIGTELLLGETINTNAAFIAKKLASVGIDCHFVTTVGDNFNNIELAIKNAVKRTDIVITTGGLGPTDDDITIEALAKSFDAELTQDNDSLIHLKEYFKNKNFEMPQSNIKQVLRPIDAMHIINPAGTAPGLCWELKASRYGNINSDKIIMSFPGVPSELYTMWQSFAEAYLLKISSNILITEHMKFFGISEARLGEKLKKLLDQSNPTVAPLVKDGEPTIRIAAKADNKAAALDMIAKTKQQIIDKCGEFYYSSDSENVEHLIGKLLSEKKLSVSTAESCTGGLISSRLTDVAGSSEYIKMNIVTYSNEAKSEMLGVKESTLEEFGAVSEQTAEEMAKGVRKLTNSDIGLSITGIAGPGGGTPDKPVGLVYVGISNGSKTDVHKFMHSSNFSREDIKFLSSQKALQALRLFIMDNFY